MCGACSLSEVTHILRCSCVTVSEAIVACTTDVSGSIQERLLASVSTYHRVIRYMLVNEKTHHWPAFMSP
jgi:hypothetical protein